MEREPKVKSLSKALKLLMYFNVQHPELGITELAELSGYLKSTTHNIMDTYVTCGFVEKNPISGKYRLGHKIMELSSVLYISHDFRQIARPFIEKIANHCNETIYLAIPDGKEVLYLDAAYPQGSAHFSSIVGVKVPMHCTGVGKAILAHSPKALLEDVLEGEMDQFTPNTIITAQALLEDLEHVHQRGYAIDDMEHEYGIRCMGIPIRNIRGTVVGSVSLSGPSMRLTDVYFESLIPFVLSTVDELSRLLK